MALVLGTVGHARSSRWLGLGSTCLRCWPSVAQMDVAAVVLLPPALAVATARSAVSNAAPGHISCADRNYDLNTVPTAN